MDSGEHAAQARQFLIDADREIGTGDMLQASEKFWGAAVHALRSVMDSPKGRTYDLHEAVRKLADERSDPAIRSGFSAAGKLHANFYHGFMEDYEIQDTRGFVHDFVERILTDVPPREVVSDAPPGVGEAQS